MAKYIATVTSKGQITIPSEIRRDFGIAPSDKIVFVIDESRRIVLRPQAYDLEDLIGIVPALKGRESVDFDELISEAQDAGIRRMMGEEDDDA